MVGTKRVRIQEKTDTDQSPGRWKPGRKDSSNANELALEIVQSAIAAAVKRVEETENPVRNIKWITQGEFTEEKGHRQIEEFISTWEYQERWLHYTEFIERKDEAHSYYYIYCVNWTMLTIRKPVLQIFTSVYFTIKIAKNKPPDVPIEVSYIFEGHSLVHRPGMTRYREKWLKDLFEAKNSLMQSIPF